MRWIWQLENWPNFQYDTKLLKHLEEKFLLQAGMTVGVCAHIPQGDHLQLIIDLLCEESLNTSEIEGEMLNRDSLRSSIRKHLGLGKERKKISPKEEGIAAVMVNIYQHYDKPLTQQTLFDWNSMVTRGRWDLNVVGHYRLHPEPMQIVSGNYNRPKIHYEAPPSVIVPKAMQQFIVWYNQTSLPALTKAAIAHLYFICIHPFEDGNGRIARGLTVKALSESLGYPALISLSEVINNDKKSYYQALAKTNHTLEINDWLEYFANVILQAQQYSLTVINFLVAKAHFYQQFQHQLNPRQAKVIARIFKEGVKGFKGGLSAKNYMTIADTTASTATRDLQHLVSIGAVTKKGDLKATRYFIKLAQLRE